jgi:two-component sensor histidine kinase
MSTSAFITGFRDQLARPPQSVVGQRQFEALKEELVSVRAREEFLLKAMREQQVHHELLAQELEHRLVNGLQLIASLLAMQARASASPQLTAQLMIASRRVAALGRVHHRLHQSDHLDHVEFGLFLQNLCGDLSNLLFEGRAGYSVEVEAASENIPSRLAVPLGFIVNELITNAAKYARGRIGVRFVRTAAGYSLTVQDDGPGLPPAFDPSRSSGLGMKITLAQVKQIGGELCMSPGDDGRGARFTVSFGAPTLNRAAEPEILLLTGL